MDRLKGSLGAKICILDLQTAAKLAQQAGTVPHVEVDRLMNSAAVSITRSLATLQIPAAVMWVNEYSRDNLFGEMGRFEVFCVGEEAS